MLVGMHEQGKGEMSNDMESAEALWLLLVNECSPRFRDEGWHREGCARILAEHGRSVRAAERERIAKFCESRYPGTTVARVIREMGDER